MYYVEAGTDDNASITTMESTHAGNGQNLFCGCKWKYRSIIDQLDFVTYPSERIRFVIVLDSDDAVGPHFPKHVLGSRTDPAVNSLGIYGSNTRLQLQKEISPSRPLDPIQEANSFVSKTYTFVSDGSIQRAQVLVLDV